MTEVGWFRAQGLGGRVLALSRNENGRGGVFGVSVIENDRGGVLLFPGMSMTKVWGQWKLREGSDGSFECISLLVEAGHLPSSRASCAPLKTVSSHNAGE